MMGIKRHMTMARLRCVESMAGIGRRCLWYSYCQTVVSSGREVFYCMLGYGFVLFFCLMI